MRTISQQHKIRIIQKGTTEGATTTWGVTIPQIFSHWYGLAVSIHESGGRLIIESGCRPFEMNTKELKRDSKVLEKVKL